MKGTQFQEKSFSVYLGSQKFSENYDVVFKGGDNKMKRKLKRLIRIIKEDINWYEAMRIMSKVVIIVVLLLMLIIIKK